MTPDVNVLVAASRADHAHHRVALHWLNDARALAAGGGRLTILPMVAAGFVRVVTRRRAFADPTPTADALAFIRAVLDTPGTAMAALGREWPRLEELCGRESVAGAEVTDAWIAAAVLEQRERLTTFDRGFRRHLGAASLEILEP